MKKILLTTLLLVSISSFGQTINGMKVYFTDSFNPKASITVHRADGDNYGVTDAIQNSLLMNGYKVISEAVAKKRAELSNKVQISDSTLNQDISIGNTTYVKSIYLVTFSFETYENFSGTYLLALNGQVVDLANDGELVATFTYRHSASFAIKLHKVVDALGEEFKQKRKMK